MTAGRNDICPCGSGKKFKKCCGKNDVVPVSQSLGAQASSVQSIHVRSSNSSLAPTQAECNQLVAFFQSGQHTELDVLARGLIEQYPHFGFVWKIWGVSLQLQGKAEALQVLQKASALLPDDFGAHSNVGNALLSLSRHDEAIAIYQRVLILKSDFAEAYFNLGIALKAKGEIDSALVNYRRALEIKRDYVEAHFNLANALRELKQFDDAVISYQQALAIKPNYVEAHYNLSVALLALGRQEVVVSSCRRALVLKPDYAEVLYTVANALSDLGKVDQAILSYERVLTIDPDDLGLRAASWLTVLYYLKTDMAQCKQMLQVSLKIRDRNKSEQMPARNYRNYIAQLADYRDKQLDSKKQNESLDLLYVIGESHCLSAHGTVIDYRGRAMRCSAQWIQGCKQWHLANDQENRYKRRFEFVMSCLPVSSTVLLTIGEIDCRPDEGIINVFKKHPERTIEEIAQTTVRQYLNYVVRINANYRHTLIICGVPATNYPIDTLSPEHAVQFLEIIFKVNSTLKKLTLEMGMDFLDVHGLTDSANGIASGMWHLDTFHLVPQALPEAFHKHCLSVA